jgi:hypothetical protein
MARTPDQRGDLNDPLAKPPPAPVGIPEAEAQKLWCQQTPRVYDPDGNIHNANCCITTKCMQWHYDAPIPNSTERTGWCALSSLAPGEEAGTVLTAPAPAPRGGGL